MSLLLVGDTTAPTTLQLQESTKERRVFKIDVQFTVRQTKLRKTIYQQEEAKGLLIPHYVHHKTPISIRLPDTASIRSFLFAVESLQCIKLIINEKYKSNKVVREEEDTKKQQQGR